MVLAFQEQLGMTRKIDPKFWNYCHVLAWLALVRLAVLVVPESLVMCHLADAQHQQLMATATRRLQG
jgi:hypothetical protein